MSYRSEILAALKLERLTSGELAARIQRPRRRVIIQLSKMMGEREVRVCGLRESRFGDLIMKRRFKEYTLMSDPAPDANMAPRLAYARVDLKPPVQRRPQPKSGIKAGPVYFRQLANWGGRSL